MGRSGSAASNAASVRVLFSAASPSRKLSALHCGLKTSSVLSMVGQTLDAIESPTEREILPARDTLCFSCVSIDFPVSNPADGSHLAKGARARGLKLKTECEDPFRKVECG